MDPKPGMDDHRLSLLRSLDAAASGDGDGDELLAAVWLVLFVFVEDPVVLGVL
jgi:hypothetical protein